MKSRLIDEPAFAAQTSALLERIGPLTGMSDYDSVLAARARTPSPAVSGQLDPAVHVADLYLPARNGPVLVRLYQARSAPLASRGAARHLRRDELAGRARQAARR